MVKDGEEQLSSGSSIWELISGKLKFALNREAQSGVSICIVPDNNGKLLGGVNEIIAEFSSNWVKLAWVEMICKSEILSPIISN